MTTEDGSGTDAVFTIVPMAEPPPGSGMPWISAAVMKPPELPELSALNEAAVMLSVMSVIVSTTFVEPNRFPACTSGQVKSTLNVPAWIEGSPLVAPPMAPVGLGPDTLMNAKFAGSTPETTLKSHSVGNAHPGRLVVIVSVTVPAVVLSKSAVSHGGFPDGTVPL